MGPLQWYLNGPNLNGSLIIILFQGAQASSIQFLPANLKMPSIIIFECPQFKWAPNINIDPGGSGPLNLIFLTHLNGPLTIIFKWPSI